MMKKLSFPSSASEFLARFVNGGRISHRRPARERRHLAFEPLEERRLLSLEYPPYDADGWQSAIFDGDFRGTLTFDFSRDVATVDPSGAAVAADEPRFGPERLVGETNPWNLKLTGLEDAYLVASGWDHDGTTPLAVLLDQPNHRLYFVRGDEFEIVNTYTMTGADILKGSVPGFRYWPRAVVVHEGLIVFQTQRYRSDEASWIPEGTTFVYTQDYGQTFARVAQVGGGFDVPGIAGGVADGIESGQTWAFSNAFPETSPDDLLGAWFPWADYLYKQDSPKGGQIGLFRARRTAVGQPWVVEPNVVVYETWEPADSGGYHAHSAGMFVDGLVSFWGDVEYRNHMTRHIASDLENYTTAMWTHNTEFEGAWSPDDAKVYRIGNQGASTAPAPIHGEVLVTADVQPELIMSVRPPEDPDGSAIIHAVEASFPGANQGSSLAGRTSLSIHHVRGLGYVVRELDDAVHNVKEIHYSPDGRTWTTLLNRLDARPYLYGDYVLQGSGGSLYAMELPDPVQAFSPLILNPGGTNLLSTDWETIAAPVEGNTMRRVQIVVGEYVYADSGEPISPQPIGPLPVSPSTPIYEVTSDIVGSFLGIYEVAEYPSLGSNVHWVTAWYHALDGDGISPMMGLVAYSSATARQARWVANDQWVPGYTFGRPAPAETVAAERELYLASGVWPGPRRWLMAIDGFVEDVSPTYPLAPGASGSNELATLGGFSASSEWTVGMSFGLPQVAAFSSVFESGGVDTLRPIATFREDASNYVEVGILRKYAGSSTLVVDVYADGEMAGRLELDSIRLDALDRAQLIVSATPEEYTVTLFSPRDSYGVQSTKAVGLPVVSPNQVLLSNATQEVVSPLEWYSVHVNPDTGLTTEQSERLIVHSDMFSTPNALPGDYTFDGQVDMADFKYLVASYIPPDAEFPLGDYNSDFRVNSLDLAVWQETLGSTTDLRADGNGNMVIDAGDYDVWLQNRDPLLTGDYNDDGGVDDGDFALWVSSYSATEDLRADGNGDGRISAADFTVWRDHVPLEIPPPDGNGDGVIDLLDFKIWENNVNGTKIPPENPGDYNRDGQVTTEDYDVWVATYGGTINLSADGNHDGMVTAADYTIWQDHLGATYGGAAASGAGSIENQQEDTSADAAPVLDAAQPNVADENNGVVGGAQLDEAEIVNDSSGLFTSHGMTRVDPPSRRRSEGIYAALRRPAVHEELVHRDALVAALAEWRERRSQTIPWWSTTEPLKRRDENEVDQSAVDCVFDRLVWQRDRSQLGSW